jgi:hypothetical protein
MKKKIYAYYESLQAFPQEEQFACANAWKASWEKHGWEAVMLNGSHAKNSNFYFKLTKKLVELARILGANTGDEYSKVAARYRRWCALHAAGGGWMCDYDVVNLNLPASLAEEKEKGATLLCIEGEPAYLFFATQQHCAAALAKFIAEPLDENGVARNESDVLNVSAGLDEIIPLVFHAKKTRESSKSASMLECLK